MPWQRRTEKRRSFQVAPHGRSRRRAVRESGELPSRRNEQSDLKGEFPDGQCAAGPWLRQSRLIGQEPQEMRRDWASVYRTVWDHRGASAALQLQAARFQFSFRALWLSTLALLHLTYLLCSLWLFL